MRYVFESKLASVALYLTPTQSASLMDSAGFSFPHFHQLWKPSQPLTRALWQPDPRLSDDAQESLKRAIQLLAEEHLAVPQPGETFRSLDNLLERFWSFGFSQGLPFTLFDLILGVHCAQRWTTNCPSQYTFLYMTDGDGTVTYTLVSSNHTHNHQPFANPFQMPQTYRPRALIGHFDCFGNIMEHGAPFSETSCVSTAGHHYTELTKAMHDFSDTFKTMLLDLGDKIAASIDRLEYLNLAMERGGRRYRAVSAPSPVHCVPEGLGCSSVVMYDAPAGMNLEEAAEKSNS